MGVPTARRVDGVQRAQKPDLGRGSHTGGSPQPMRMTLRLCCCRAGAGISAVAAPASRRRDRAIIIVLVQCSVAKRCGCRARC